MNGIVSLRSRALAPGFAFLVAACAAGAGGVGADGAEARALAAAPAGLDDSIRVFAASGTETGLAAALDELARADVVFCGETHLDDVTHRTELAIYEGLLDRRGGKVVLALEMFATDVQGVLDDYVAGRCDEATFLRRSNPWGNYATGYRALVERARRDQLPVIGANAPQALVRRVSAGGAEALAALPAAERALMPPELLPNSAAYWARVAHATRGHLGGGSNDPEQQLYSVQSLWDNTMGWSCARALERFPGCSVLHVNGGFHTAHGDGTASQLQRRRPQARVATVQIEPCADLGAATFDRAQAAADFTVLAQRRARGLDEGFHAVSTNREQRFRLHRPDAGTGPMPLLVWVGAAGVRAEDGLALWRTALGDDAMVAVLEPPYAELEPDLSRGGAWFWNDTFDADTAVMAEALAGVRRYLDRHFASDPARVVVAGDGEGATVVVAAALWGDITGQVLAFSPRGHRKLAERGLPEAAASVASLRVFTAADEAEWWRRELAQHGHRQLTAEVAAAGDLVTTVRAALGLPALPAESGTETLLVRGPVTPRARAWRDLVGVAARAAGKAVSFLDLDGMGADSLPADLPAGARALAMQGEWPAELEAALAARGVTFYAPGDVEAGLPLAPGPFGGTTILVVPAGVPAEVKAAWQAVVAGNPLQRRSRFHRLELAFASDGPDLAEALGKMVAAQRRNALVVPAAFCADAETMQALRQQAAAFATRADLTWLPGLGGQLAVGK